jgi:hypothetical protein
MSNQFLQALYFMAGFTQEEKWCGQYGVLTDSKIMQRYEDAIFLFR